MCQFVQTVSAHSFGAHILTQRLTSLVSNGELACISFEHSKEVPIYQTVSYFLEIITWKQMTPCGHGVMINMILYRE